MTLWAGMLFVALSVWVPSAPAEVFSSSVPVPTIQDPGYMTAGDVNGDGHLDFMVGSVDSNGMYVYLGDGDGNYTSHVEFASGTYDLRLANLDGDTHVDLAQPTGQSILLFYGAGDGTFPVVDEIFLAGSTYESARMALGDFNGDGRSDFAVTNYRDPGSVSVLLSKGDGTYNPKVDYATFPGPDAIEAVDVNGDGRLDLVVSIPGCCLKDQNAVSVFLGNADGTFSARQDFGTGASPTSLLVHDLNSDLKPDIAVTTVGASNVTSVSVLFGVGDGTFGVNTDYAISSNFLLGSLVSADFDLDGDEDLVALEDKVSEPGRDIVLLNNGNGAFPDRLEHPGGVGMNAALSIDFNADGRVDLLLASAYSHLGDLRLYLNCVPCVSTAIEVALLEAFSDGSGVHLRWAVSQPEGAVGTIERRTVSSPWESIAGPLGVEGRVFSFDDGAAAPGERYGYRLVLNSSEGMITTPETWVVASGDPVPRSLVLNRPVPNPTGGPIRVQLGLPRDANAELAVFDVRGRLVARVSNGHRSAGWHDLAWNGKDLAGRSVASGTYFLRLTAGSAVSRRFVVLR